MSYDYARVPFPPIIIHHNFSVDWLTGPRAIRLFHLALLLASWHPEFNHARTAKNGIVHHYNFILLIILNKNFIVMWKKTFLYVSCFSDLLGSERDAQRYGSNKFHNITVSLELRRMNISREDGDQSPSIHGKFTTLDLQLFLGIISAGVNVNWIRHIILKITVHYNVIVNRKTPWG